MNLWLSLNKAISLYGDKEGIIDGEKRFTYAQFGDRVANLAQSLLNMSLSAGSVIAIAAPNCHEFMESYYSCGISGIVLCPLNYRLAACEIAAVLNDADAQLLIVHIDFAHQVAEILDSSPSIKTVVWVGHGDRPRIPVTSIEFESLTNAEAPAEFFHRLQPPRADDLAHLYYTSGTTGRPKGVMLTQGNVTFNALAVVADLGLREQDVWLHAAPLFHLADAWATFAMTWVGAKHVLIPYFHAGNAMSVIDKEKVTLSVLVPTMLNAILNEHSLHSDKYDCTSLRMLLTGGSPIAPEVVRKASETFQCEYVQLYGMTETSPFLTLSLPKKCHESMTAQEQLEVRARTGRPYIGAEVRVIKPDGCEVKRDDRDVGEIVARGPTIFTGYWKQPDVTAETLKNGWIHTGDLATIDEHGFINIVDRAKDMIITGGENVYSNEVEYALHEHPKVLECAVFGIPDEYWGEAVKAVAVARANQTLKEDELITFLKERLANYKVPKSIEIVAELPKTGSGKIYKKGLRETY